MSGFQNNYTVNSSILGGGFSGNKNILTRSEDYFKKLTLYPSYAYVLAVDNLIKGLISNNQLQYFDAIYLLANQNNTSALKNIAQNLYNGSIGVAPTNNVNNSIQGNGTNMYVDLNLNPSTAINLKYKLNDAHIGCLIRTSEIGTQIDMGVWDGTNGSWINSQNTVNSFSCRLNSSTAIVVAGANTSRGYFVVERKNPTQVNVYKDGINLGAQTLASSALPNKNFFGLATSSSTTPQFYSAKQLAIYHIGKSGLDTLICKKIFDAFLNDISNKLEYWTFFGDSVTLGQNASTTSKRWTSLLSANYNVSEDNFGVGGMTASQGSDNPVNYNNIRGKSDYDKYLFITFGLNDSWKAGCTATTFETGLTGVLNAAISRGWTANKIKLTSDFFMENGTYTYASYALILAKIVSVGATFGIQVIDFHTWARANGGDTTWLNADLVHPTDKGYQKKYEFLKSELSST